MTELAMTVPVPVPFSSACEYAGDFFKEHPQLRVHSGIADTSVASGFRLVDDSTDSARVHDAVLFSWHAKYALLPDLAATLRVRPDQGKGMLYVNARYVPPLGALGLLFDRLAGRRIAKQSLREMLYQIQSYIIERYKGFQGSLHPDDASRWKTQT